MKEEDLLYHFPFRIDKMHNFRNFADNHNGFTQRYIPNYDGTHTQEFLYNKSGLSLDKIHDFEYLYENFSQWSNWYKNGRNIFSFSKELLTLLDKTDVSEIKPDLFKLPYDIFYISLKPLNIKISKESEAIIEGVYIDHNIWNGFGEHPEGYCELALYFVGEFKEVFMKYISNVKSSLPITIHSKEEFDEIPLGSFWSVYLWFEKSEKRETVKEALDYFITSLKEEIFINNKTEDQVSDFDLDFYSDTSVLLSNTIILVINCLLYLSQPKEKQDIDDKFPTGLPGNFEKKLSFARTQKEKNKIAEKIEQMGFSKINYVGHSFSRKYDEIIKTSTTVQPHWRRGHWRNQKFGEKLLENKLIWIMPTIVKSELGEPAKGHLYDIQPK